MFKGVFATLVLVLFLTVSTGTAQDPTKVASTHYKLAFEN
jgi:hypothetical protein